MQKNIENGDITMIKIIEKKHYKNKIKIINKNNKLKIEN